MDAIETLVRVMAADEASPGPAVAAAKALLDRAWGTAPATVEVKGNASAPLAGLTAEQLVAIVKAGRE